MIRLIDDNTGEVLLEMYDDGTYTDLPAGWALDDIIAGYRAGWIVVSTNHTHKERMIEQ